MSCEFDGVMAGMNNPDFLVIVSVCLINMRNSARWMIILDILSDIKIV